MKYKTIFKHLKRELRHSIGRFVSLFAITALGASFFVGLSSSGPNMLLTADTYFKHQQLADYRLLSTYGFTESDIELLENSGDYSAVFAAYALDVLIDTPQGAGPVRITGLPEGVYDENGQASTNENNSALNLPVLLAGRMPTGESECLADSASGAKIGDVITLSFENDEDTLDMLNSRQFTVVGLAQSPYYIYFSRGATTLKDGQIDSFYLVPNAAFNSEYYLEVWLRDAAAEDISSFSSEYAALQENAEKSLETFGEERAQIRFDEIMDEANEELNDAKAELADGQQELSDAMAEAETEFADAQSDINSGWADIYSAEQDLTDGQNALNSGKQELENSRALLVSGQAAYDSGLAQYNAGVAEYEKGAAEFNKAQSDLNTLKATYDTQKQVLDDLNLLITALKGYETALTTNSTELARLTDATTSLPTDNVLYSAEAQKIATTLGTITAILPPTSAQKTSLEAALTHIATAIAGTDATKPITDVASQLNTVVLPQLTIEIAANEQASIALTQAVDSMLVAHTDGQNQLNAQKPVLDAAKAQLDQSGAMLASSYSELQQGYSSLAQAERDADIAGAQKEIDDGFIELQNGKNELYDAQKELDDAKAEAETEFADAQKELDDAVLEIADAEEEIAELEEPVWYVQTREQQPGYSGYSNSVDSINAISGIFPVFFYLVSTLVCLTTMTRMVEENRGQIGTLKTLGYSRGVIAFEYLFYGTLASLTGALVGSIGGSYIFPLAVWESYSIMYSMGDMTIAIHPLYFTASVVSSVAVTGIATLGACIAELRSVPATLLRPKAPRAGKRILLEYIKPLWNNMNFSQKVTSRNIFRYKSRFLMTVIGVAGCTALLVTGFGLNDTVGSTFPLQFGRVYTYDAFLALEDSSNSNENTQLNSELDSLTDYVYFTQKSVKVNFNESDSGELQVGLYIAEQPEKLGEFIHFYNIENSEELSLENAGGVFITEKIASTLGITAGDEITLDLTQDEKAITVTVAAVVENYLSHFVYITPDMYTALTGDMPQYNSLILEATEGTLIQSALEVLLEVDNVAGSMINAELEEEFSSSMDGLSSVIWLAIISASALAVVVLYNLTNINIIERTREIATLKVLGFYPKESAAYIYKESFFLTLIGALAGLVVGIYLHEIVLQMAAVDDVLFNIYIKPVSFVFSVVFTLLSLAVVDIIMFKRLKNIDMIESLAART